MCRQNIFHIFHCNLLLRHHAPRNIIRSRSKVCIRTVPFLCVRIQITFHKPCTRCIVYMICIIMAAKSITWVEHTIHRKIQMIFFNKFFQVCRAHVLFLLSESIFQIKGINSQLVRHYHIHIVRNSARHPVMSSDRLQPPDLILILKSNSVHLISSIFLQQASETFHALSCTVDIRQNNINNILFSDTACDFFFPVLCRLINNQRICTENTRIGSDGFCGSHSDIGFIHTTCSPHTFSFQSIRHGCISHWVVRQFDLYMRNLRFIFTWLRLRMSHHKFLSSKMSGTIVGCFLTD